MAIKIIKRESKKDQVIEEVFKICKKKNNFEFHNDVVKAICKKMGLGNPFDVAKLDNKKNGQVKMLNLFE